MQLNNLTLIFIIDHLLRPEINISSLNNNELKMFAFINLVILIRLAKKVVRHGIVLAML